MNQIRQWIITRIFSPLRGTGAVEVKVRAGDLHAAVRREKYIAGNRMPMVSKAMSDVCRYTQGVRLIRVVRGSNVRGLHGANIWCVYRFDDVTQCQGGGDVTKGDEAEPVQSKASRKRVLQRLSTSTSVYRKQIDDFLRNVDPAIAYRLRQDLRVMTNMPYYKRAIGPCVKSQHKRSEINMEYARLLLAYNDIKFAGKLLRDLNKNQNQTLRKLAPRIGEPKDVWEHAIPSGYVVNEIIKLIKSNTLHDMTTLLALYEKAGQRALTREQDEKLKPYSDIMPDGWNWRDPNVDWKARYNAVGLPI
jgi:hypothetical protein